MLRARSMAASADRITTSAEKNSEAPSSQRDVQAPKLDATQLLAEHNSLPTRANPDGLHDMHIEGLDATAKHKKPHDKAHHAGEQQTNHQEKAKKGETPLPESEHVLKGTDTWESIARQKLGKGASADEVGRYGNAIMRANHATGNDIPNGTKVVLPGRTRDGEFVYHNPENKDEVVTVHKDNSFDAQNSKDGTRYHQEFLDDQSDSFIKDHHGPKPGDNYREAYFEKNKYTFRETRDADGTIHDVGSDGTTRTKTPDGSYKAVLGAESGTIDLSFDAKTQTQTTHDRDGSTTTVDKDGVTTVIDRDGTKTTDTPDTNTHTVEKPGANGDVIKTTKVQADNGNYTLDGTGPSPADNFHETYDSQTGQTIRTEAKGTTDEKTTTRMPDGTIKVETPNGDSYVRKPDGSEHHWGDKTFDKPATDYTHDAAMNQARTDLENAVKANVPADRQADFKQDMSDFEARAKQDHLSPDEITKTYGQLNKLLNAKDSDSAVPAESRARLAEQLIHQTADPYEVSQGAHETCNVTTVAKETLAKSPSQMAEIATSTALTGQFTAPDGKVIKIDKQSLVPGAEESNDIPKDGERSYATQVLNVALVNDALQRRNPPETYLQRTPDRAVPGDTGERRLDASGNVINATMPRADANGNIKWLKGPANDPNLTAHEIAWLGKTFNGDSNHVIDPTERASGTEMVKSSEELGNKLKQFKDQGVFPVSIGVDANHPPLVLDDEQKPGVGGHIVNVVDYNPVDKTVLISNNWDSNHNGWVPLDALYKNSSGEIASSNNGTDIDWPDKFPAENK